jgi:hypothetical protein
MTYLSEDPTYLAGAFLLVAGAFLITLNVTKQGKYLATAGIAFSLALVVILIEWMWVTDNERIEKVVYDIRTAVLNSDAEAVIAHLAPDVTYSQEGMALSPEGTCTLIRSQVSSFRLEFASISELQTSVGQHSRRGKAEFRVFTRGGLRTSSDAIDGARPLITSWSLGFQETEPRVWKITRISPLSVPKGVLALARRLDSANRSGFVDSTSKGASFSRERSGRETIADVPATQGPSRLRRGRGRGRRRDSLSPDTSPENN